MNVKKNPPSAYSSRRQSGMKELRFWLPEEHRKALFDVLRDLINNNDPVTLQLGLLELRLVLAQQKAEQAAA